MNIKIITEPTIVESEASDAQPKRRVWYRCNECGWEHTYHTGMVQQCGNCGKYDTLHIITNADGETPKHL